jgi:hypothetical protein
MPNDYQPGRNSGGPDYSGPGLTGQRRPAPWFGRKRVGFGYGPQTWQGWTVTALLVAFILTAGGLAPNTLWFWIALVVAVLIPPAIVVLQRRA